MDTSLLRTVFFVLRERKPLHFLYNTDTPLIRTLAFYNPFIVHINGVWPLTIICFPSFMLKLVSCTAAHSRKKKNKNRKEACVHWLIRHLKQRERWRPGRHKWTKWQTEVDIFSLSVLWLDKFVQRELKQKHSDSLYGMRHRTSGCYSWRPGRQRSCCLKAQYLHFK